MNSKFNELVAENKELKEKLNQVTMMLFQKIEENN